MKTQETAINSPKVMLCLLSGLLLTAGFPLTGVSYAAWVAVVFLLFAIRDLSALNGFYLGLLTGFVHFVTLLYWLAGTMHTYGFLPLSLSVLFLLLLAVYLSSYIGGFAAAMAGCCESPAAALVMAPVLWVGAEYLRSFLFSGFPWGLIGYSQYKHLHLIQISDIFGIHGISFLVVFANSVVFFGLARGFRYRWRGKRIGNALVGVSIPVLAAVIILTLIYGKGRLTSVDRMIETADAVKVAVVQGNIPQPEKWDEQFQEDTVEKYLSMSRKAAHAGPDLVVWPETAAPFYFEYDEAMTERVLKAVDGMESAFLIGAPAVALQAEEVFYYNSAYLAGPDGNILGRYDKVHLVPFGEYVPLKKWLPFIHKMVVQVGEFQTGEPGTTLKWERADMGVAICYEIIFPRLCAAMVYNHAGLLVNITNDAWFGNTSAPYQHFSMAVFRAVENRRSLVRAANTGISGFIDPAGRILEATGLFKAAALTRGLPVIRDMTSFYTRHPDLLALFCFVASLLFIMIKFLIRRFKKSMNA